MYLQILRELKSITRDLENPIVSAVEGFCMQVVELSLSRLAPRAVEISPTDGCIYVICMHLELGNSEIQAIAINMLKLYISYGGILEIGRGLGRQRLFETPA